MPKRPTRTADKPQGFRPFDAAPPRYSRHMQEMALGYYQTQVQRHRPLRKWHVTILREGQMIAGYSYVFADRLYAMLNALERFSADCRRLGTIADRN